MSRPTFLKRANPLADVKWYRNGEPWYERGLTAGDIVRYERDELGNDDGVTDEDIQRLDLDNYPAKAVMWVCKTKKDARRYGNDITEFTFEDPVIVCEDGDKGYLVLDRSNKNPNWGM